LFSLKTGYNKSPFFEINFWLKRKTLSYFRTNAAFCIPVHASPAFFGPVPTNFSKIFHKNKYINILKILNNSSKMTLNSVSSGFFLGPELESLTLFAPDPFPIL